MVKVHDLEVGEEPGLSRWAQSNPQSLKAAHPSWWGAKGRAERNLLLLKMEEGSREPR